jgi:non-heme chloroperoxidase
MATRDVATAASGRQREDGSHLGDTQVTGGGGVRLHVVEAGNPAGRPILFLHGQSQCRLSWRRQLGSDLADTHRLVAMDLRGHGRSAKPRAGYADSRLWAADVDAAIRALRLDRPVLCGWSYGPLVILDYLRHYGEDRLGGICVVGGVTKLGTAEATAVLAPAFVDLLPGLFATAVQESVRALEALVRLCSAREPSAEDLYLMLGYNVAVPPYVRQALLARSVDNDDLLPRIRKPVLISYGRDDAIVRPAAVDQLRAAIPHAQVHTIPDAGHAAFWDDPAAFNRRLGEFCASLMRFDDQAG